MALTDVVGKLRKAGSFTTGDKVEVEFQPTPSARLNRELGGGVAYKRMALWYGNKSAGKTSILLQTMGLAQQAGKVPAFVDVEGTFDPKWARRLGVDPDQMLYSDPKSLHQVDESVSDLLRAGADFILLDSITGAVPSAKFDKKNEEYQGAASNNAIGSKARQTTEILEGWTLLNEKTSINIISQTRNVNQGTYWTTGHTNGQALSFYSSQVISLFGGEGKDNHIQGEVAVGDGVVIKQDVGRKVTWKVVNNKLGPCWGVGEYDFYFQGPNVGVDEVGEYLDLAVELQLVKKAGAWYGTKGEDLYAQGRDNVVLQLREQPDVFQELKEQVSDAIG